MPHTYDVFIAYAGPSRSHAPYTALILSHTVFFDPCVPGHHGRTDRR